MYWKSHRKVNKKSYKKNSSFRRIMGKFLLRLETLESKVCRRWLLFDVCVIVIINCWSRNHIYVTVNLCNQGIRELT